MKALKICGRKKDRRRTGFILPTTENIEKLKQPDKKNIVMPDGF